MSHSPRHTFQIGNLVPASAHNAWTRCTGVAAQTGGCNLDKGKRQHCGRDEYVAYMKRVVSTYQFNICEHERVLSISVAGKNTGWTPPGQMKPLLCFPALSRVVIKRRFLS